MSDESFDPHVPAPVDPEGIARKTFRTALRGFDQMEVKAFLIAVADSLRDARDQQFELELKLSEADKRVRRAEEEAIRPAPPPPPPPPTLEELEPAELARLVGDETARVLETAREAARDIVTRSEKESVDRLGDSEERLAAVTKEADELLDRRRKEAGDLAASLTEEAEQAAGRARAAATAIRESAEAEAEAIRADAATAVDRARSEADRAVAQSGALAESEADSIRLNARREADETTRQAALKVEQQIKKAEEIAGDLVREAEQARGEVLEDLARRRRAAKAHLVTLQAGRERMLEAFALVRGAMEPVQAEIDGMLTGAKSRADEAAAAAERAPELTADELDAALVALREAGRLDERHDEPAGPGPTTPVTRPGGAPGDDGEVVTTLFARIRADQDALERVPSGGGPAVVTTAKQALTRALTRALIVEQDELVTLIDEAGDPPAFDQIVAGVDDQAGRYASVAQVELSQVAYAGAQASGALPAGDEPPDIDDLAAALAVELVGPLRERLLAGWAECGDDARGLGDGIRGVFRQAKDTAVPGLAGGAIDRAYERGLAATTASRR